MEFYIPGNADDLCSYRFTLAVIFTKVVGASDRRTGREEGARHVLADDGYALRPSSVLRRKTVAGQDGNLHRLEIAVADDVMVHVHVLILRHAGYADAGIPATLEKGERGKAGRFDSRKRVDTVLDLLEEGSEAGIVALIASYVGVDVEA